MVKGRKGLLSFIESSPFPGEEKNMEMFESTELKKTSLLEQEEQSQSTNLLEKTRDWISNHPVETVAIAAGAALTAGFGVRALLSKGEAPLAQAGAASEPRLTFLADHLGGANALPKIEITSGVNRSAASQLAKDLNDAERLAAAYQFGPGEGSNRMAIIAREMEDKGYWLKGGAKGESAWTREPKPAPEIRYVGMDRHPVGRDGKPIDPNYKFYSPVLIDNNRMTPR